MSRLIVATLAVLALAAPSWASEAPAKHLGIPDALWLPLNLAAFVFLLYWFVGRPMGRFLQSRRESIGVELEEAQKKLDEAEELRRQVLQRLEQVEEEMAEIKLRAESEGQAEAERIAAESRAEEERFVRRVEDEITRRQAETRSSLAEETAALTAQLAHELLAREITAEDRKRILERSLSAMRAISERK